MRRGGRPKISGKSFLWENKLDMKKGCNILKSSGTSAGLERVSSTDCQRSSGAGELLGRTAKSEVIATDGCGSHGAERDPELGLVQDAALVWKNRIREAASEPAARKRSSS